MSNALERQTVAQLINPSESTLQSGGNENIGTSLNLGLFIIAGKTRNIVQQYALQTSAGNINFYALVPFKFNDANEPNKRYRNKTMWASISLDPARSKNDPTLFFNNNAGVLKTLLKPFVMVGDKKVNNPYNMLNINGAKLAGYPVPANIDEIDNETLVLLNKPVTSLQRKVEKARTEGLEGQALIEVNTEAYKVYLNEVMELYDQGHLSLSTIIQTPKQNSISMSIGIDETMESATNVWLNASYLLNQEGVNLNELPVNNNVRALVSVTEADVSALFSDNDKMFGERILNQNAPEGETIRLALSKVALIKDYGVNVPILLSITDGNNSNNRSRVQAFKDQLDRGNTMFQVEGTVRPVARLTNSNAGRSGIVFFELSIDTYSVYKSNSLNQSIDIDDFADLETIDIDASAIGEINFGEVAPETAEKSGISADNEQMD